MPFNVEGGDQAEKRWVALRKVISSKSVGKQLLKAMDASAHGCAVAFVDDTIVAGDGGATAGPEDPTRDKVPGRAMLKHFAPDDAIKAMAARDRLEMEITQGWRYYFRVHGNKNPRLGAAIRASGMSMNDVVERLKNKHLANGLGVIDSALIEKFVDTPTPIPGELLWRLIWLLRPYIEPGSGAPARIKIANSIGSESRMNGLAHAWRSQWGTLKFQEGHIIVFHELVHAFRVMQGTRVVDTGWEEEAMTMGLPPFEDEPFTENKYRAACRKELAKRHGSCTFSSQTMAIQCQSCNDWGKNEKIFYP